MRGEKFKPLHTSVPSATSAFQFHPYCVPVYLVKYVLLRGVFTKDLITTVVCKPERMLTEILLDFKEALPYDTSHWANM